MFNIGNLIKTEGEKKRGRGKENKNLGERECKNFELVYDSTVFIHTLSQSQETQQRGLNETGVTSNSWD